MAEPAAQTGWSIETEFAAQGTEAQARNFYALYEGEHFGAPERGALAVIARGHADGRLEIGGVRDAVQIAVHSLAEGYFGAGRTVTAKRSASVALASLNRWLAGQQQGVAGWNLAPVSLSALLMQNKRIGLVQVGSCQMYRLRDAKLTQLMHPHLRPPEDGPFMPSRALGLGAELMLDIDEEEAKSGDIYLLIAGLSSADGVYAALSPLLADAAAPGFAQRALNALAPLPAGEKSVMVLRLHDVPGGEPDKNALAALQSLPIRTPPREGDVWDGFTIGKLLYRGRYTMLVQAYDQQEKREVALKLPLPSMLQDEVFTAGFMREAWIGTAVRGMNVVHYIDVPEARRSSLYLVMPLYVGETLERRLNRAPQISLPEGIGIAFRLCEAVQDLAAIDVVHRDLKPDNVMLLENGEVRLLDLGLAYLPGIDHENAARPGGTLRYMAPELLKAAPANARTEVYALGVTFYRMFASGAFPYGQHEKRPLARMRSDLPSWLGEALGKAISPRPEDRFADCGEFAEVMQAGLAGGRDSIRHKRFLSFSSLQLWRAVALIFLLLFCVTLIWALQ